MLTDRFVGSAVCNPIPLNLEPLEPRIMLNGAPQLPGLYLVDPNIDNLRGQLIYLDFDGEKDVTYNGPVTVGPFDVPAIKVSEALVGQEKEIISAVTYQLSSLFSGISLVFIENQPKDNSAYSTVYIGGNDAPFKNCGSFNGLAEDVDIGNQHRNDNAFVFSQNLYTDTSRDAYISSLSALIAHEIGHLLGYAHIYEDITNPLSTVAAVPNQPTFSSVPSAAKLYPYTYSNPYDDINGPYTVVVDYTDPDGSSDLKHTYLQLTGNGTSQTIMYYNLSSAQQWDGEGGHLQNISASKTAISNGYRVTYRFQLNGSWTPSKNVDFVAWSVDESDTNSSTRTYNWNGIYDNNLTIYDARKASWVDNDGDGYYSSVRIEADADTSVSSRTVLMDLYMRNSATGGSGSYIWDTGSYTTSGTTTDWKGYTVTVASQGIYDFAWELYDPSWYITNIWYDQDADISNIKMEPTDQDKPPSHPDKEYYDDFRYSGPNDPNFLSFGWIVQGPENIWGPGIPGTWRSSNVSFEASPFLSGDSVMRLA